MDKEKMAENLAQASFILEVLLEDIGKLPAEDLYVRYHTTHLRESLAQVNKAYDWINREIRKEERKVGVGE